MSDRAAQLEEVVFHGAPGAGAFAALQFDVNVMKHSLMIWLEQGRPGLGVHLSEADLRKLLAIVQREVASYDRDGKRP